MLDGERLVLALGAAHQLGLAGQRIGIERQPVGRIAAREVLVLFPIAPACQALGDLGLDLADAIGAPAGQRAARQDLLGGVVELAQQGRLPAIPHIGADGADIAHRQDQQQPEPFR